MQKLKTAKAVREALDEPNAFANMRKGDLVVHYWPQDNGRGGRAARWTAERWGYFNDPNGYWRDHGQKTFTCWSAARDRAARLAEAIAWMTARYKVTDFVKDPWGSYQPRAQLVARLAKHDIEWTGMGPALEVEA